jgi:F-type H+-transporting ATPase subunit epsilon
MIDLKILLPERTYWQGKVKKIVGEATNSSFCLAPAHVDLVTIMVPGIFLY